METVGTVELEVVKTHAMVVVAVHRRSVAEAEEHPEREHAVVTR